MRYTTTFEGLMDYNLTLTVNDAPVEELVVFKALKGSALALLVAWTVVANCLVFVVLYKNPRLQTVPNLLVGNLAFSDLCLGFMVLPLSAVYAIAERWIFGKVTCELWLSADILCCTASIWNLSMIGLDRYWAITSPITYMNKRNKRNASIMIAGVWVLSALISLAPFLGWKSQAELQHGNYRFENHTGQYQCTFLDLPGYTVYSATGSFFVPTFVMFFVYMKIYHAFADHRARQIYRQKVIRKHIESTILHEISHVLPTSDEFAKSDDDDDDDDDDESDSSDYEHGIAPIIEEDEGRCLGEFEEDLDNNSILSHALASRTASSTTTTKISTATKSPEFGEKSKHPGLRDQKSTSSSKSKNNKRSNLKKPTAGSQSSGRGVSSNRKETEISLGGIKISKKLVRIRSTEESKPLTPGRSRASQRSRTDSGKPINFERVLRHKNRREKRAMMRKSLQKKPPAISAAKERRGVKVLGIILGCFIICWTPFFIMYLVSQFCLVCRPNVHIDQFITWLGYSNSAMNPIIYTVFNRDYQNALKRLFTKAKKPGRQ